MNKTIQRVWAAVLVLCLLITAVSAAVYGEERFSSAKLIAQGSRLYEGTWLSEDTPQSENYILYSPNADTVPVVAYGNKLYGTSTYQSVQSWLTQAGETPVAAINGDFFNTSNGLPNGLVITDGVVRGSDGYQCAVGFKADGSVLIGKPSTGFYFTSGSLGFSIAGVNRVLSSSGVYLYTPDFSANTRSSQSAVYVIFDTDGQQLVPGTTVRGTVTGIVTSSSAIDIPEGRMILAAVSGTDGYDKLSAIKQGQSLNIAVSCAEGWQDVVYACGAGQMLVENGYTVDGLDNSAAPRTAVGVKADGSVIFYTVDGRQSGLSQGVGLRNLAYRLIELGCVTAVNLDGGGSTVMGVSYPGKDDMETVNAPSDGSLRKCANFIFLVNRSQASGTGGELHIYPYDSCVMPGASVDFTAYAADSSYHTMPAGSVTYSSTVGTMSAGQWTAPAKAGNATITAYSGGRTGSVQARVMEPDQLIITRNGSSVAGKSITMNNGNTADFSAIVKCGGVTLTGGDSLLTWSVSGGIGTVTKEGLFTASAYEEGGSGKITVSYGCVSSSVTVTVPGTVGTFEGFEGSFGTFSDSGYSLSKCTDLTNVLYGSGSGELQYSVSAGECVSVPFVKTLSKGGYLGLWIKGNGSGDSFSAVFSDDTVQLCTLDFTGWRYVSCPIPSGANLAAFRIAGQKDSSGILWLDSIHESTDGIEDNKAPVIAIGTDGAGSVLDGGKPVNPSNITVTFDRQNIGFSYDGQTGALAAELPEYDTGLHLLTVTARDMYGNRSTRTVELGFGSISAFADTGGHWAEMYVSYLYDMGILTGSAENGVLKCRPDNTITRNEFAAILCRWMGVNTQLYEDYQLPYEDTASIPQWALPGVKAMTALGIITGSRSGGHLRFEGASSLTRAQAMTMLGRTQSMGYGGSTASFSDRNAIPAWADTFIGELTARGVVSGSGGKLNPQSSVTRAQMAKMLYAMG